MEPFHVPGVRVWNAWNAGTAAFHIPGVRVWNAGTAADLGVPLTAATDQAP